MRLSNRTRKRLALLYEAAVWRAAQRRQEITLTSPFGRVLPPAMHERLRVLRYKYPLGVAGAIQRKRVMELQREAADAYRSIAHAPWKIPLLCSKYIGRNSALLVSPEGVGGISPALVIFDEMGTITKDQWDKATKKPDPMEVD